MMKEFKTPIKKAWQTASRSVEVVAPIVSTEAPSGAPTVVGAMWVKQSPGYAIYVSVNTSSVSDWVLIAD